ncbi:hypothetical protein RJ55_01247 [Drechmeria coniospora]|nr:hypothetical protein RJ55_01247 [Drechmeria coniospora]
MVEGRKYRAPKGIFDDSPLYTLYRMYEWIMVGHVIHLRDELEIFWWTSWPVSAIPDPGEQGDADRYAVLACIQPHIPQLTTLDDPMACPAFKKRNILAIKPHIHFI